MPRSTFVVLFASVSALVAVSFTPPTRLQAQTRAAPAPTPPTTTPATAPDWVITPGVSVGAITGRTTLQDLLRLYGAAQVREQPIDIGEGASEPGVVLFPADPARTAELLWQDPERKRAPALVRIRAARSLWHTTHGIKIGTTLREVERLNGKAFQLAGFGWDGGGVLTSYAQGELAALQGKLLLRFTHRAGKATPRELQSISGDKEVSSAHPVMQKLNPSVEEITCRF